METPPPNEPEGIDDPQGPAGSIPASEPEVASPGATSMDSLPPPAQTPSESTPYEREGQGNLPQGAAGTFGEQPRQQTPQGDYQQAPLGYANYPRYFPTNRGPVPPGPPVVRFSAIGEAWELIRQDLGMYAVASLIMAAIVYGVDIVMQLPLQLSMMNPEALANGPFNFPPGLIVGGLVISVILQVLAFVFGAGFFKMCLQRLRGEPVNISYLFSGFKLFGPLAIAGLCTWLVKSVSMFLLIIPGFFTAGALVFVPLLIMDQRANPFEAMALSFTAVKGNAVGNVFTMGALAFVLYILAMLGSVACCVGVLFTAPIYFMTLAMHYHAYFPPQAGPEYYAPQAAPQYSV